MHYSGGVENFPRFLENWSEIAPLGFDAPFRRLWEFYLCYCEAGFLAGNIDVVHFELTHR